MLEETQARLRQEALEGVMFGLEATKWLGSKSLALIGRGTDLMGGISPILRPEQTSQDRRIDRAEDLGTAEMVQTVKLVDEPTPFRAAEVTRIIGKEQTIRSQLVSYGSVTRSSIINSVRSSMRFWGLPGVQADQLINSSAVQTEASKWASH